MFGEIFQVCMVIMTSITSFGDLGSNFRQPCFFRWKDASESCASQIQFKLFMIFFSVIFLKFAGVKCKRLEKLHDDTTLYIRSFTGAILITIPV